MENLQTEIQEMEFFQFSKGLSFMRKEDFAEWLLLFTNTENKDVYWKNVRERLSAGEVSMPFHYACDGQEVGSPTSLLSSQVAPTWTRTKPPRVSERGVRWEGVAHIRSSWAGLLPAAHAVSQPRA